ncbi:hypothetical protein L2E82_40083 [Cichorium intybus]|uniref:Uncharacterized protein n=1 Tax=Cichorium intybus TaxID=13427 RepID=A0ACB9APE2_CICIN|nr:hypothetical protein L2E82_40083 [Cichorium intybus]
MKSKFVIRASPWKRDADIVVVCDPTFYNLQTHSLFPLPISDACAIPHHVLLASSLYLSLENTLQSCRSVHDPKPPCSTT